MTEAERLAIAAAQARRGQQQLPFAPLPAMPGQQGTTGVGPGNPVALPPPPINAPPVQAPPTRPHGLSQAEILALAAAARRRRNEREQPQRTFGQTIYENVIGSGEVDTPGERLGQAINDMGRSFFPGMARSTTGMLDMVPDAANAATGIPGSLYEALTGNSQTPFLTALSGSNPLPPAPTRQAADLAFGADAMAHRGDTRAERIAGTVGEFMPGALGGGPRVALGFGVAPGVASEMAGEVTQGTAAEPYARAAAGLGTALLSAGALGGALRPPGSDGPTRQLAESMRAAGVTPTAGQITGSGALRAVEGTMTATPGQIAGFTRAAMRTLGSDAPLATREALSAAQRRIVGVMDDAVAGLSFRPTQAMAQQVDDIVDDYMQMAPGVALSNGPRGIADEIIEAATSPQGAAIDLSTLQDWRRRLGRLTSSSQAEVRQVAADLRRVIDDATDTALQNAGRSDDAARLAEARNQYRNFIAVRDAATRGSAEAGTLSPTQLNQSVIRTQGRNAVAVGRGTDLEDLSRAGAALFRPAPTVEPGAFRRLSPRLGFGTVAGGLGLALSDPQTALAASLFAAGGAPILQGGMRSRTVQALLNDPAFTASAVTARSAPGLFAAR